MWKKRKNEAHWGSEEGASRIYAYWWHHSKRAETAELAVIRFGWFKARSS
jgi:hypothetical protein